MFKKLLIAMVALGATAVATAPVDTDAAVRVYRGPYRSGVRVGGYRRGYYAPRYYRQPVYNHYGYGYPGYYNQGYYNSYPGYYSNYGYGRGYYGNGVYIGGRRGGIGFRF